MRAVAFILLFFVSATVSAQEITSESLFEEGAKQYLAGQYEGAIVSWQKGYALGPAAIIVYNIALANGKLENYTQAIAAATRAENDQNQPLDDATRGKNAANRQAWQMALRSTRATERIRRDLDEKRPFVNPPVVRGGNPVGWMGWTGITAAILGVGALGTSGYFALQASKSIDDAKTTVDPDEHASLKNQTEEQQTLGQIFLYSGAGLLAVGTTLFILDRAIERDQVAIQFTGRHVGVTVSF